jgi:hypothetical protein
MRSRAAVAGIPSTDHIQLPYRMLALRVIHMAIRDAVEGPSPGIRSSARHFLSGCPLLSLWCTLAEIDPESIGKTLRDRVLFSTRRPRRTT